MNQQAPMRLILVMVVLSERRILRYLNLRNWVHQKIDTHCSMTNFKAAHKFIHTFNYTFYFSSFYTFYGFRFVRRNSLIVLLWFFFLCKKIMSYHSVWKSLRYKTEINVRLRSFQFYIYFILRNVYKHNAHFDLFLASNLS